jgi:acyl carrier protein
VEPRSALERFLAIAWADLLNLDRIGIQDDFFDLGGHSLLAVQVVAKLRDELQVSLPLESLTEAPTVAGLADLIATWNQDRQAEIEQAAQHLAQTGGAAAGASGSEAR